APQSQRLGIVAVLPRDRGAYVQVCRRKCPAEDEPLPHENAGQEAEHTTHARCRSQMSYRRSRANLHGVATASKAVVGSARQRSGAPVPRDCESQQSVAIPGGGMIDVKMADRELQTYIRPQTFPVAIRMLRPDETIPDRARRPARDF